MSSFPLVVAPVSEAYNVSLVFSEHRWSTLGIDLYATALHKLVAKLKNTTCTAILDDLEDLTPRLEGAETAEPWDERFWVPIVQRLSESYVQTIVGIENSILPQVASWLYNIDEFELFRGNSRCDFDESTVTRDLRKIRDFLDAAGCQTVLVRGST